MAKEEAKSKKTKRPTAEKRMIQNQKRRLINKSFKSRVRTTIRALETTIESGNPEEIKTALDAVYSILDKGIKKALFQSNKANRLKSRLAARAYPKMIAQ